MSIFDMIGRREKYDEIELLHKWCLENGVIVTKHKVYDGFYLRFNNGTDVQQHLLSSRVDEGYLEFGYCPQIKVLNPKTGKMQKKPDPIDFAASTLEEAKEWILKNKEILNTYNKRKLKFK